MTKDEQILTLKARLRRCKVQNKALKNKLIYAIQELKEFGSIEAVRTLTS